MKNLEVDRNKVDAIINYVSKSEGISWSEARTLLHKYVCGGKCNWYKTKSKEAHFDRLDLTEKQKKLIEEKVKQAMKDSEIEEAKWRIHRILCPGHPRPRPQNRCKEIIKGVFHKRHEKIPMISDFSPFKVPFPNVN